jgi:hypothetical protein
MQLNLTELFDSQAFSFIIVFRGGFDGSHAFWRFKVFLLRPKVWTTFNSKIDFKF